MNLEPGYSLTDMRPFFYKISNGIRITVKPLFLKEQSDPDGHHYVFAYFIRIENVGLTGARLMSRRWLIHDEIGSDTEVVGDGVVGEQPLIKAGCIHEYQSFCILKSGEGYMEGEYTFMGHDGSEFQAQIPRFMLSALNSPTELS